MALSERERVTAVLESIDILGEAVFVRPSSEEGKHDFEFEMNLGLTFDKLAAISEAFKTKLIDVGSGASYSGCQSCGYGQEHWVEVSVRNATIPNF